MEIQIMRQKRATDQKSDTIPETIKTEKRGKTAQRPVRIRYRENNEFVKRMSMSRHPNPKMDSWVLYKKLLDKHLKMEQISQYDAL